MQLVLYNQQQQAVMKESGHGHHPPANKSFMSGIKKFYEWYNDDLKSRQRVLDEGVTQERALALVRTAPFLCDIPAAVEKATTSDRRVHPEMLAS